MKRAPGFCLAALLLAGFSAYADAKPKKAKKRPASPSAAASTLSLAATVAPVIDDADRLVVPEGQTYTLQGSRSYAVSIEIHGTLLVAPFSTGGLGTLELSAATILVSASGLISADGAGHGSGTGPGAGTTVNNQTGGGAGHGGLGGGPSSRPGDRGKAYGSLIQPFDLGSGGGNFTTGHNDLRLGGGRGGGKLKITAGTLRLDGRLSADAFPGDANDFWGDQAGGGSGGSILINAQQLEGSGVISANGGASSPRGRYNGGGGGGGRVAIAYANSVFSGAITARGGPGFEAGGAGTIVYGSELRVENNIAGTANTPILPGTYHFQRISISSHGVADVYPGASLSADSLSAQGQAAFVNRGAVSIAAAAAVSQTAILHLMSGTFSVQSLEALNGGLIFYEGGSLSAQQAQVAFGGTLSVNARLELPQLMVSSGGMVTHAPGDADFDLAVLGILTIEEGGKISADGAGYAPGTGPGAGRTVNNQTGSGAGHGGLGGGSTSRPGDGGLAYGSLIQPFDLGSGGGNFTTGHNDLRLGGGRGGGKLRITAGTLRLDGRLSADAFPGDANDFWGDQAGGGSGGSILINAQQLEGSGVISANGGASSPRGRYNGGGGGGGRVAIAYANSVFSGAITARGGPGFEAGGAGTVVYGSELRVDNGISGSRTPIFPGNYNFETARFSSFANVEISSAASMVVAGTMTMTHLSLLDLRAGSLSVSHVELLTGSTLAYNAGTLGILSAEVSSAAVLALNAALQVSSLRVGPGGILTHSPGDPDFDLSVTGDLTIEAGGHISANGTGYGPGQGPGAGSLGSAGGGGGGYGGYGAASPQASGGAGYGLLLEPSDLGSGGGSGQGTLGGSGGGLLRLDVSGTLRVDGLISADGQDSQVSGFFGSSGGGGSGGSILIRAATIAGGGAITSNGGNKGTSAALYGNGGGGGGGRIAVVFGSSSFTGTLKAQGGFGLNPNGIIAQVAGAGTVVYGPQLRIANGLLGARTVIPPGTYQFDDVLLQPAVVVEVSSGVSLSAAKTLAISQGSRLDLTTGSLSAARLYLQSGSSLTYHAGGLGVSILDISSASVMTMNAPLRVSTLLLRSGGFLTHSPGDPDFDLSVSSDLTIEAGSGIFADAAGYDAEQGPGKAARVIGNGSGAPGAGHGGPGGAGQSGAGGASYGSLTQPGDMGSGGGSVYRLATALSAQGGRGGGRLRIQVGSTLRVDGAISANGGNGVYDGFWGNEGGGGSGGSILIDAGRLEGSGRISAQGGFWQKRGGGGGSGGRVALYYGQRSPSLTLDVRGGAGHRPGGTGSLLDNGVLVSFEAPSSSAPVALSQMQESLTTQSEASETLLARQVSFTSLASSGTIRAVFSSSEMTLVTAQTGAFAGLGFFRGRWSTSVDGAPLSGQWEGIVLPSPDGAVLLKGVVKGGLRGTLEGRWNPALDDFQALGRLIQAGDKTGAGDWFLAGSAALTATSQYPATPLNLIQTSLTGVVSGHYSGPLDATLTLLRVNSPANPYHGEGFLRFSHVSALGSGEGWAYAATPLSRSIRLAGILGQPLLSLMEGSLAVEAPRSFLLSVERLDMGLDFQPELFLNVSGSDDVSPAETLSYAVELRNDGFRGADNVSIIAAVPDHMDFLSASGDYSHYDVSHWRNSGYAPKPFLRWDLTQAPAKSTIKRYFQVRVRLPSAPGAPRGTERLDGKVYVVPTSQAEKLFSFFKPGEKP